MNAGIYIHVPFCAVKCPYCDFYSTRYSADAVRRYTDAVCRNLRALPRSLQADTLYFGGGTPSLLQGDLLRRMIETAGESVLLAADAEITLEVNPLTASAVNLAAWRDAGINRLSLGVQSFQADVLNALGRKHQPQQAQEAVLRAADAGFRNLSVDLMLGLAMQSPEVLAADLEAAYSLPVTHISAYLLKIEPQTPFAEAHPELPDDDTAADRWLQMHEILTAHGFTHYEISNFAKAGSESRHNCKYWRCEPYYGIGPAAHSFHDGKRFAVPRNLEAFCAAEKQPESVTETQADTESERIMLGLRLSDGICLHDFSAREILLRRAKPLIPQYLTLEQDRLWMTPEGWLVSNAVLAQLLRDF